MVPNVVTPETELTIEYGSRLDTPVIIVDISTGRVIPILQRSYIINNIFIHRITFQTPFRCMLVDYFEPIEPVRLLAEPADAHIYNPAPN